jgi:predicted aspartyl protease
MSQQNGDDAEESRDLNHYRDYLKRVVTEPRKSCRLVSNNENATVPFALLMRDAQHIQGFGLDVKLNDRHARLEIDTGAGGILVSRSVAEHAGLKQFSRNEVGGIGSQGQRSGYIAYADDIKIGSLEFRDCEVQVIDQRNVTEIDGLIGMDVFSHFLVTLDYPMRKLILGPLPQRPDDKAFAKPSLQTDSEEDSADEESGDTSSNDASSPAKPSPKLHDRYIAPEMKDWTKVYRIGHNLLIPTSLNGSGFKTFILDTGAFSTTITPDVARAVTKVHSDDNIIVKGISGKVNKVYSADEITFRFANISQKVRDVVAFDTPQVSKNLDMEVSGFIGITALGQTTMSIDYRDGLVKFSYDANRGFHITPN